jgi:hypothetical protein
MPPAAMAGGQLSDAYPERYVEPVRRTNRKLLVKLPIGVIALRF